MKELERELEEERKRLNELGLRLIKQSISLADNREMQELSQKVDLLVVRSQRRKRVQKQHEQ
ncbi:MULTISPECIES: aspartyl-phosphate phosphatase Spo0E family protein [Paenibacillus]|uniref:aspartyl-phosphate phosphatase Spo0E family protein n=1 Tax=Paenibacillus TaxID=44249 RepID=UPI0011A95B3E|nr:aspartyl-phosphate phosphatase Spo0E family protein [Paenibacillus sp. IHBB 10380]